MSPKKESDGITVREFYQLLDQKISEVNASMARLEAKFDQLEAGRLTRLETRFAELSATQTEKARNMALWVSIGVGILFIVIQILLQRSGIEAR